MWSRCPTPNLGLLLTSKLAHRTQHTRARSVPINSLTGELLRTHAQAWPPVCSTRYDCRPAGGARRPQLLTGMPGCTYRAARTPPHRGTERRTCMVLSATRNTASSGNSHSRKENLTELWQGQMHNFESEPVRGEPPEPTMASSLRGRWHTWPTLRDNFADQASACARESPIGKSWPLARTTADIRCPPRAFQLQRPGRHQSWLRSRAIWATHRGRAYLKPRSSPAQHNLDAQRTLEGHCRDQLGGKLASQLHTLETQGLPPPPPQNEPP